MAALASQQVSTTGQLIADLAKRHGVRYVPGARDAWANEVTRLADDEVVLDEVELLLVELQRSGYLSLPEALRLQASYLREEKP